MASNTDLSIIPFSHLDLFWAGTREECLSRGSHIIRQALALLDAHDDYRFMIESTNFLEHHLSCFPEDRVRLRRYAQAGADVVFPDALTSLEQFRAFAAAMPVPTMGASGRRRGTA